VEAGGSGKGEDMIYIVTIRKNSENTFQAVLRYEREAAISFLDATEETETYEIKTRSNINQLLDVEDNVIVYEVYDDDD
jgi:hypothetical protein